MGIVVRGVFRQMQAEERIVIENIEKIPNPSDLNHV